MPINYDSLDGASILNFKHQAIWMQVGLCKTSPRRLKDSVSKT